jgi:flagellar basal body-associated protein FliL
MSCIAVLLFSSAAFGTLVILSIALLVLLVLGLSINIWCFKKNNKTARGMPNTKRSQRANPIQIDKENKLLQFTQIPVKLTNYYQVKNFINNQYL